MPCFKIFTNLTKDKIPSNFIGILKSALSVTLRKPEATFVILISTDCTVNYGDHPTSKPGAVATLESIGHVGLEENKIITNKVTEVIQNELGIDPEQFLMTFYDMQGQNIGKAGVTLA